MSNLFYAWLVAGFIMAIGVECVNNTVHGLGIIIYLLCLILSNLFNIKNKLEENKK